jgi:hypothetical protein
MQQRSAISKLRGRHYASLSASTANKISNATNNSNAGSVVGRTDGTEGVATPYNSSRDDDREMQLILAISDRLETGLNEYALQAIVELLQRGVHPDAIVGVVTSLAQRPGPV